MCRKARNKRSSGTLTGHTDRKQNEHQLWERDDKHDEKSKRKIF